MDVPEELRYSTDHEWARVEGDLVRVGITDYARDALGDIVFLSLPAVGDTLVSGASVGEVESTKAVSEIYTPLEGEVVEINAALVDNPEVLNDEPYGAGWLFILKPSDPAAHDALLDATAYRTLTEG